MMLSRHWHWRGLRGWWLASMLGGCAPRFSTASLVPEPTGGDTFEALVLALLIVLVLIPTLAKGSR